MVDFCVLRKNLPMRTAEDVCPYGYRNLILFDNAFGVILWRREWDSNPRPVAGSLVFKTSSLNRSDISP